MLVDLHVHTALSRDSKASAEAYVILAANHRPRLDAICLTEHRLYGISAELEREHEELEARFGVRIFRGIEADTNLGHLLIFGVTPALTHRFNLEDRMLPAERLIEVVHGEGGVSIPAHPFRDSGYGARLDQLVGKLGGALNTVEAINGQNTREQDAEAVMACAKLGLNAVGGSDAHFASPAWFLNHATQLEHQISSIEELCVELRAGHARPYSFHAEPA
jgi:predicted metal-dependent phosphoesterase TrpH